MTTTDAVTARHVVYESNHAGADARSRLVSVAFALILGAGLAGCGSTNLLGPSDAPIQSASTAPVVAAAPTPVSRSTVGLATVMGAPDAVSKQVGTQLGTSLEKQRVSVAQAADKPDYTLRGYMVATRERAGPKVSYIFDLTDAAGKRVNRIQGEEMAQGGDARDPWAVVTPEMAQRISDKTATSLATALASLGPGAGNAAAASPPVGVGAAAATPGAPATPAATPVAAGSTGSIDRTAAAPAAAMAAQVPAVVGAPGDGNDSLSNAMKTELQQAGIGAASAGQRAYSVAGKVAVTAVKDGKQSVKIDWRVTDPGGTLLATVTQNNEIPAGTLDGQWGGIASDAAQGAASRIKQIIDENQANGGVAPVKAAQRSKS